MSNLQIRRDLLSLVAVAILAAVLAASVSSATAPPIVTNPTWSPNGKDVAFAYTGTSSYRIVKVPASGGATIKTIASAKNNEGCCDPMLWSATGRIAFVSNFTLMSVPATGGRATRLAGNAPWFLLSPNGATAAFHGSEQSSSSGVGLVTVSGGKPLLVPRPANATDILDGFSPDGTDLIFSRALPGGAAATPMVEHIGGGTPVPLTSSGLIGAKYLPTEAVRAEWSPNGRWIAFLRKGQLDVVSTANGTSHVLEPSVSPYGFSWSPNSKLLACICGANREHLRFTTLAPQGTSRTVLWSNPSLHYISVDSEDRPQWSPDSSKLAFMARVGPGNPPTQIWVVGANGHGPKRIA
jgi:Tol biopolymer transport system component